VVDGGFGPVRLESEIRARGTIILIINEYQIFIKNRKKREGGRRGKRLWFFNRFMEKP
jgi:hypothetical protein